MDVNKKRVYTKPKVVEVIINKNEAVLQSCKCESDPAPDVDGPSAGCLSTGPGIEEPCDPHCFSWDS